MADSWNSIKDQFISPANSGRGRQRNLFYSRLPTDDPATRINVINKRRSVQSINSEDFKTRPCQGGRRHSFGGFGVAEQSVGHTASMSERVASFLDDEPTVEFDQGSPRNTAQIAEEALGGSSQDKAVGPAMSGFFFGESEDEDEEPVPEDPTNWSSFVERSWFQGISALISMSNVLMLIVELDQPETKSLFFIADNIMLSFYVLELCLRVKYFERHFLCGPPKSVCWNLLDITVVVAGLLDQWALPLLLPQHIESIRKVLQPLRLLRLLRVFKIVRVFLNINLSWTEGPAFQSFIGVVILVNSLLMGMEIDIPWCGWFWFEQVLLCIYVFELFVRLKHFGCFFFSCSNGDFAWNVLDFLIVGSSVLDSWLIPLSKIVVKSFIGTSGGKESTGMSFGKVMMLMRMLRLMRILRLAKLVKAVRPLYILVTGVMAALQGVVWVLVLTMVTLYAMGILATSLIGKKMAFGPDTDVSREILKPFSSVPDSMFTLFKIMSGAESDAESLAMYELMGEMPSLKLGFVFFMITSSWTLLSILTAVVSENMISTTNQQEDEHRLANAEEDRIEHVHQLKALFEYMDISGDGQVQQEEIAQFLANKKNALITAKHCRVPVHDVREVLQFLTDATDGDRVSLDKFVEYLADLSHVVTEKSVMKLEAKLTKLSKHTSERFANLEQQMTAWQEFANNKLANAAQAGEAVCKGPLREVEKMVLGLAQRTEAFLKKEVQQMNQEMIESVTVALEQALPKFGVDQFSEMLQAEFNRMQRELLCNMRSQESDTRVKDDQQSFGNANMKLLPDQEFSPTQKSVTMHSATMPHQVFLDAGEKQTAGAPLAQAELPGAQFDPLVQASIHGLQQQGATTFRNAQGTVMKLNSAVDQGMSALAVDEFSKKMASDFRMMRQELLSCLGGESPKLSNVRNTAHGEEPLAPIVETHSVRNRAPDVQVEMLGARMEAKLHATEESIHDLQQKTEAMLRKIVGLLGRAEDHGLSGLAVDKFLEIMESELCMMRQEWLSSLDGQNPGISKVRHSLQEGAGLMVIAAASSESKNNSRAPL